MLWFLVLPGHQQPWLTMYDMGPCLPGEWISITCAVSVLEYCQKWKYNLFYVPKIHSTRQVLIGYFLSVPGATAGRTPLPQGDGGHRQGGWWYKTRRRHQGKSLRTVTSHERHWRLASPATGLFVHKFVQTNNKKHIKALHYWPFVRGIHRWPVTPHTKGQ